MWANVRSVRSMTANASKQMEPLPIALLTEIEMFDIADLMTLANVIIDDGIEFGLANELSTDYQMIEKSPST